MLEQQLKLLEKLIVKCVKRDYNAVSDALDMKRDYLNKEQFFDYIRKEVFRITDELVAIEQKVSPIQAFTPDVVMPHFIWDSTFNECLTRETRQKYVDFCYESFDDELYSKNPTSYDDTLPDFSSIVKFFVYRKFWKTCRKKKSGLYHDERLLFRKNPKKPFRLKI